ncbi:MAG TPA: hypothetical protein VII92_00695, partial [Anaerolineae bacterium]
MALNGVTLSDHDSGTSDGAGIECYDCQGTWQNVALSRNVGDGRGGGQHAYLSTLTIQSSTIDGNTADDGGGIHNEESTLQLINVTVSGNQATANRGGLYNDDGSIDPSAITMTNVTLKDNGAVDGGG